jgi:twitching motility protein PilT
MRKQQIDYVLTTMLEAYENVSDLNMTVDKPFQVETFGVLKEVPMRPPIKALTPFQTETIALNLIGRNRRLTKDLLTQGSCDLSYQLAGKARFRVNVFSQKGCFSTVMRLLPTRVPTIDELRLPDAFHQMSRVRNGIIMITGATGTGKTTSLAAILNEINEKDPVHVVTLEDPVEYVHSQKTATFNQREMGIDFSSFSTGLRAALRQAPKVILVGEMRDRETVEIAMAASETGHLVLSTIHTVDAGQTINRIIGMFETEEENHVRNRLAGSLRWVACQRLLPKEGGGRIAAFEIMASNLRVQESIRVGESEGKTFYEIVESGRPFGMMTFDQSIADLYRESLISEETALSYCSKRSVMGRALDSIKSSRGEKTTDIEELRIDTDYGKGRQK